MTSTPGPGSYDYVDLEDGDIRVDSSPTTAQATRAGASRLAAALAAFQGEAPVVAKSRTANIPGKDGGRGYAYSYAGLADVVEAAYPLLAKNGLSFVCLPTRGPLGYELVGVLLHESGERLEGVFPIFGQGAQQIGSSLTYGRRYLLGCLTGLVTDDDDDGQAAGQARGYTQGQGRQEAYDTGSPQRAERVKQTPADDPWYTQPPTQTPGAPADDVRPVSGGAPPAPSRSAGQPSRVEPTVDARTAGGAKKSQVQALTIKFRALGVEDRDERLTRTRNIVGREDVSSANDLTEAEVLRVLDVLEADLLAKQDSAGKSGRS